MNMISILVSWPETDFALSNCSYVYPDNPNHQESTKFILIHLKKKGETYPKSPAFLDSSISTYQQFNLVKCKTTHESLYMSPFLTLPQLTLL